MPRSNPSEHGSHPCTRWFEWDGERGGIRYYNNTTKENVPVADGFTFILLDSFSVIKGWHDASESGITSNEVRDTTSEPFVVKAFKGGVLATGIYQMIRDRVASLGGKFNTNLYVAFKDGDSLSIGSIKFHGAALAAWMEFSKKNRSALYSKAIQIKGFKEGKKGKIVFRTPNFVTVELSKETDDAAGKLQEELKAYMSRYLSRPKAEQVESPAPDPQPEAPPDDWVPSEPAPDSDVPF